MPRDGLWQAQTPQVFRRDWICEAYAQRTTFAGAITDDAQLVEALGHSIFAVNGSARNFKITTRDDLDMAEALLKSKGGKKTESRPAAAFGDERSGRFSNDIGRRRDNVAQAPADIVALREVAAEVRTARFVARAARRVDHQPRDGEEVL